MTDDATPEDLGKPPVGGPLRPDQLPPGFPDPNAPRLEFGPGSAQRDAPPRNGAPQQSGAPQQNGAPQQQPGHPGQPWQQPNRPAPSQAQQPRGPETFRPSAPYGQPHQNQQPGQQHNPTQGPGQNPNQNPNPNHNPGQNRQQFGPAQPFTGQQPFGPGQQPGRVPFSPVQQPGQHQPGQHQPGQQQPFRPGAEYGNTGQLPQFGAAPASAPKPKRKPLGRRLWAGVLIGAVVASLIAVPLTLLSVGRLFTPMLDRGSVQTGVAEVLKEDFGLADVEKVECPGDQAAVAGTQFECTFSYSGSSYPVAVEVINDQGQYRVGIDAPK